MMQNRHRQVANRNSRGGWGLVLTLVLTCLGVAAIYGASFTLVTSLQRSFAPADTFYMGYTRLGSLLMYVSPLLPSFTGGLLLANLVRGAIPALRGNLDQAARASCRPQYAVAVRQLWQLTLGVTLICLPLTLVGAHNYFALDKRGPIYSPLFSLATHEYKWDDVKGITTRFRHRRDIERAYILDLQDGREIDLLPGDHDARFLAIYAQLEAKLKGRRLSFDASGVEHPAIDSQSAAWQRALLLPPRAPIN
jgi:hypothetical protein